MSPPHNRSPLAQEARKRMGHGVKELAQEREERERERREADAEQVGRSMHERNASLLGRDQGNDQGDTTQEGA